MDAIIPSKKRKRTPANAARSAHGLRLHGALPPPPPPPPSKRLKPPKPRISIPKPAITTGGASVPAQPIITTTAGIASGVPKSTTAGLDTANIIFGSTRTRSSARDFIAAVETAAPVTITTTAALPPKQQEQLRPTTTAKPKPKPTAAIRRPITISVHKTLTALIARLPPLHVLRASLCLGPGPNRPLFPGNSKANTNTPDTTNHSKKKQQQAKAKQQAVLLRRTLAHVIRTTHNGRDAVANAIWFVQVLSEIEGIRGAAADGRARLVALKDGLGQGDEEQKGEQTGTKGERMMLLVEVFKMLVILISWRRPLPPALPLTPPAEGEEKWKEEEEERVGSVMSARQVVGLVEMEIEEALRVQGVGGEESC